MDLIKNFTRRYRNPNSGKAYVSTINKYFKVIDEEPNDIYLEHSKKEIKEHILKFFYYLQDETALTETSIKHHIRRLRKFLKSSHPVL